MDRDAGKITEELVSQFVNNDTGKGKYGDDVSQYGVAAHS